MPPPPSSATVSTSPELPATGSHSPAPRLTALYLGLLCLHLLLLWLLPCFPTQDGPSHIYNLAILHDLLSGGKVWGQAYYADLRLFSPNHGFTMVAYPLLAGGMTPLLAERFFVSVYLLALGGGIPLLLRACRVPTQPVALLLLPVIFNHTLLMGFYSYNLGAALLLVAIALTLEVRTAPRPWQIAVPNLAGALLFFCHLIPFMVYLLFLALQPLVTTGPWRQRLGNLWRRGLCCAPLLALYGCYSLTKTSTPKAFSFAYLGDPERWLDLLAQVATFGTVYFSPWQGIGALLLLSAVFALLQRRRQMALPLEAEERLLLRLAALLLVICLLAPFYLGGGSYFNERFPWLLLLLILPVLANGASSWQAATPLLTGVALLTLAINAGIFWQQGQRVEDLVQTTAAAACTPGSGCMLYKTATPSWPRVDPLLHAASAYALRCRAVDLGNYETDLAYFPVHFRADYQPRPMPTQIAYRPASIDFTHQPLIHLVIGWQLGAEEQQHLRPHFHEVQSQPTVSVWQRRSP